MPIFTPELIAKYAATIEPERDAPAPPSDQTNGALMHKVGLPVMLGGNAADLITTLGALSSGRGQEANPVLGNSPARIALMKAAGTGGLAWLFDKLGHSPNPQTRKAALIAALASGAVGTGLAIHNAKVGK